MEIKGINGDISATAASGGEAQVIAKKTARKSDVDDVTFKVVEHAGGVTICVMYPAPRGKPANECAAGGKGRMNNSNNDVTVDFEIRVPRGVQFTGRTVNGTVRATGLTADAEVYTVNGGVRVETTGLARASMVNGSFSSDWPLTVKGKWGPKRVRGTIGSGGRELGLSTVNGDIELRKSN